MSEDRRRVSRRRVLGAAGTGIATTLAGCGYQTGAGDLDWTESYGWSDGAGNPIGDRGAERWWGTTADRLVSVRNRSGRTHDPGEGWVDVEDVRVRGYDSSGSSRFTVEIEPQYRDVPIAVDGTVYLTLEDGTIAGVDVEADDEDDPSWTTADPVVPVDAADEDGAETESSVTLAGGRDGSIVAVEYDGTLAAVDVETGSKRFEFEVDADEGSIDHLVVGGDRVWITLGGRRLRGYDPNGSERVDRTLPDEGDAAWLVGTTSSVVAGLADANGGDRVVAFTPDGEGRTILDRSLEVGSGSESEARLAVGDRLYLLDGRSVAAVAVDAGEERWTRDSPFRSTADGAVAADEDGLYGYGSTGGSTASSGCSLVALSSDGETRWTAETPPDVDCSSDLRAVGDRLVAIDTGRVYGFHRTPGRR